MTQVASKHQFLKAVRQLHPVLYATLRLLQTEYLCRAIYYSLALHSWSEGLPLLEQCLISLTAGYGDYIPTSASYAVCPVSFSDEDVKRHEREFEDIVHREEWLELQIMAWMKAEGIVLQRHGCVNEEVFEEAQDLADKILRELSAAMPDEVGVDRRLRRHWPFREGKFVLSMESCV